MINFQLIIIICSMLCVGRAWATEAITCELSAKVVASSKFTDPTAEYTALKNDSSPMVLIGIDIQDAQATGKSTKLAKHKQFCRSLIGTSPDAYLSGHPRDNQVQLGETVRLSLSHTSAKRYPFWPNRYVLIK